MQSPRYSDESLPGFVKPDSYIFYLDDPPPHEMTIKISNPYGFHAKYKVLSSDAEKYTILSNPQGYIKPMNFQEVTICHKEVIAANINFTDTIRVQLYVYGQQHPHFVKNISVTLHAARPEPIGSQMAQMEMENERFHQLSSEGPPPPPPPRITNQSSAAVARPERVDSKHKLVITVISAVVCLVALCLPCHGDEESLYIPSYLHVSHTLKLIVAYILGLLTSSFLRS